MLTERIFIGRVCESKVHREVQLKKHERCPLCNSEAVHLEKFENRRIEL